MSPLEEATCDELMNELGNRCQCLLVVGVRIDTNEDGDGEPGKRVTMTFTRGGIYAALGLAVSARRSLTKEIDGFGS